MSYESARQRLRRTRQAGSSDKNDTNDELSHALEQLTDALEEDLAQIKMALSHVARLLER